MCATQLPQLGVSGGCLVAAALLQLLLVLSPPGTFDTLVRPRLPDTLGVVLLVGCMLHIDCRIKGAAGRADCV